MMCQKVNGCSPCCAFNTRVGCSISDDVQRGWTKTLGRVIRTRVRSKKFICVPEGEISKKVGTYFVKRPTGPKGERYDKRRQQEFS